MRNKSLFFLLLSIFTLANCKKSKLNYNNLFENSNENIFSPLLIFINNEPAYFLNFGDKNSFVFTSLEKTNKFTIYIDGQEIDSVFYAGQHLMPLVVRTDSNAIPLTLKYKNNLTQDIILYKSLLPFVNLQLERPFTATHTPENAVFTLISPKITGYDITKLHAQISIRGATSAHQPKKPYKVKLAQDVSLLGLRDDNEWILDAMFVDPLKMRTSINFELYGSYANLPYADKEPDGIPYSRSTFVEVFVNGNYEGLYALREPIDRKQLKLKKSDGLLFKGVMWMSNFINIEPFNNQSDQWLGFEQKHPSINNWEPLYQLIDFVRSSTKEDFEANVFNKFDRESLIDYILFLRFLKAEDNIEKNYYLAKYNTKGKWFFVPWDLDNTLGFNFGHISASGLGVNYQKLFNRLETENPAGFNADLLRRWNLLKQRIFTPQHIQNLIEKNQVIFDKSSVIARDNKKWGYSKDIEKEKEYIVNWVKERILFLDNYFANLPQ